MKKLSIFSTLAAVLLFTATGCLKDKEFEAGNYGIQIAEIKAVAFPGASKSPLQYGLDVSASTQTVSDLLNVTIEAGSAAETDVVVTLANTTGTAAAGDVKAYNDANGTNVQVFPANLLTIPGTVTIPAGQKFVKANIIVSNTTSLNPNLQYGVGITITDASSGYQVAANQRKILIIFGVKNAYDGKYELHTRFYHPTAAPTFPLLITNQIEMVTYGPDRVKLFCLIPGLDGNYHPWSTGSAITAFAGQEPVYVVNPATNAVTVYNDFPATPTIYSMGLNGFSGTIYEVSPTYNSRWEPATKTMYANFGYNLNPGGTFNPAASRMWIDTLIRTGPR